MFSSKRQGSSWRDVDYMTLVPVQRMDAAVDPASGEVAILMPRYTDPVLGRFLQPRLSAEKRYIRVPLEERGAFLWRLFDGERTVADLVRAFRTAFPDDNEDAPTRVALYLHAMYDNSFINYVNAPG